MHMAHSIQYTVYMSLNLTFGTKVGPAECMVPKKKLIEKRFLIYEFYHPAAFARITCIRRGASAMSARLQGTQATSINKAMFMQD